MPTGTPPYIPRLSYEGTEHLDFYQGYSNIYQRVGLGMSNCTAYAYGRWSELANWHGNEHKWPNGSGNQWYPEGVAMGFEHGMIPRLGAAGSWDYGTDGHVAIVEQINYDSHGNIVSFVTSNSGYNRDERDYPHNGYSWFWTYEIEMDKIDSAYDRDGRFMGFIYHPNIQPQPTPSVKINKGRIFRIGGLNPRWYIKKRRNF